MRSDTERRLVVSGKLLSQWGVGLILGALAIWFGTPAYRVALLGIFIATFGNMLVYLYQRRTF